MWRYCWSIFHAGYFWNSRNMYVSTKLTLDVMGLNITTLSQEPVNHSQLLNWKSFIKLVKVVIHDYGTFSKIKLFKQVSIGVFFNLIGHCVVMEVNRKMTGCLQTFGGHCKFRWLKKHNTIIIQQGKTSSLDNQTYNGPRHLFP